MIDRCLTAQDKVPEEIIRIYDVEDKLWGQYPQDRIDQLDDPAGMQVISLIPTR